MFNWYIHDFDWAIIHVANCESLPGRVIIGSLAGYLNAVFTILQ
jgi:hypothetical protein